MRNNGADPVQVWEGPGHKPRELTPFELRQREEARQRIRGTGERPYVLEMTARPAIATSAGATGAIEMMVVNPANPHLSLYREFRAGIIDLATLLETIDASVCGDEKLLKEYEHKSNPSKPAELYDAEEELAKKVDPSELSESLHLLREKIRARSRDVDKYLKTLDHLRAHNASNLAFMREIYERQRDRNQLYAAKVLAVIETHQTAF